MPLLKVCQSALDAIGQTSYAMIPELWQSELCDGFLNVTDNEAITAARALTAKELFAGYTAGGNVAAALKVA